MIYFYSFLSVMAISFVSLFGVFTLSIKEEKIKKHIALLVSLAVGALLGDAFIHLIPESFEIFSNPINVGLLIITGIFLFFILEKYLHWHHHGEEADISKIHPVGKLVLLSDGFHNFIDGLIIGVSFMADTSLGIATTLAVLLHEIPQEIGDFAVLLHAGYSRSRALWLNFLSALTSVLGLLFSFFIGEMGEKWVDFILPVAAGGFIYIAVADLIPELHKGESSFRNTFLEILFLVLGVLTMVLLAFLE